MAFVAKIRESHRGELAAHPLGNLQRAGHGRAHQQASEFLTAEPAEQVTRTHGRRDQIGKSLEDAIAGLMARCVVDLFEAVEIEQKQRSRAPIGDRLIEHRFAAIEETRVGSRCRSANR